MNNFEKLANKSYQSSENEYLNISFKYIDWNCEHFFLQGLKNENYKQIFDALEKLKNTSVKSFREQTAYGGLNPKSIFNTKSGLYDRFNSNTYSLVQTSLQTEENPKQQAEAILKQAFEIRIAGRNQGRIHGFLWNNTFHIVWFDPAHNLYYGRKQPQAMGEYATVKRCFSPEQFEQLQRENAELYDLLDTKTAPES
ncbi:hypothetical protein [Neisseria sp. CCUG12390]|uniref:hypothetical protein n=1 Tax=Neisseria sp. CCUG12390 TaxID=3392035 RepID=UPI003A0FFAEA